jgi:endonuclease YncB( thermonuclease family)
VDGKFFKFSARLQGIDAPEKNAKLESGEPDLEQRKWADASKSVMEALVLHKMFEVKCIKYDKYGRLLVDMNIASANVSAFMIDYGFCMPYDGGKKQTWDFSGWDDTLIKNNIQMAEALTISCETYQDP